MPEGPLPPPRVGFRDHCPPGPRANTQPLFPGPWERGGEGKRGGPGLPPPPAWPEKPPNRFGRSSPKPAVHPQPGAQLSLRRLPGCAGSSPTSARRVPGRAPASAAPRESRTRARSVKVLRTGTGRTPRPARPYRGLRPGESPPRPGAAGKGGAAGAGRSRPPRSFPAAPGGGASPGAAHDLLVNPARAG